MLFQPSLKGGQAAPVTCEATSVLRFKDRTGKKLCLLVREMVSFSRDLASSFPLFDDLALLIPDLAPFLGHFLDVVPGRRRIARAGRKVDPLPMSSILPTSRDPSFLPSDEAEVFLVGFSHGFHIFSFLMRVIDHAISAAITSSSW